MGYKAEVVDINYQVRFSDGTLKWCSGSEIRVPFVCAQCGQKFATESGRDNHWWDTHIVTCSECGKVFDNETLRDEHWWDAHIVYCKQCGKICSNIRSLVQHARDVHQYAQNLIDV